MSIVDCQIYVTNRPLRFSFLTIFAFLSNLDTSSVPLSFSFSLFVSVPAPDQSVSSSSSPTFPTSLPSFSLLFVSQWFSRSNPHHLVPRLHPEVCRADARVSWSRGECRRCLHQSGQISIHQWIVGQVAQNLVNQFGARTRCACGEISLKLYCF